jgi:hypothetical protein
MNDYEILQRTTQTINRTTPRRHRFAGTGGVEHSFI